MPYQVNGQAVATKSQRLSQGAGAGGEAGAAAGGGALVTMSAALAALSGAAMSNAKTPAMPSEVTFMVSPSEGSSLPGGIFAVLTVAREVEIGFRVAFPRIVATGTQYWLDDQPLDSTKVWLRHRRQVVGAGLLDGGLNFAQRRVQLSDRFRKLIAMHDVILRDAADRCSQIEQYVGE
jgi:hypothetical protein